MPSQFASLDSGFPSLNGNESLEEKMDKLYNYNFMLLETLRYLLRNLGAENFSEAELEGLKRELASAAAKTVTAETIISNTVITGELYADYGAVADLTVDELRTDWRRAQNWLVGSTAQLDYIYIHDEQIDFITAVTNGSETVQLSRDGRRFFWLDGTRTRMTCMQETAWPVYAFRYTELTKLSIRFQPITLSGGGSTVMPVIRLGAGDGQGNSMGYIYKDATELRVRYLASNGTAHDLVLGDSGVTLNGVSVEVVDGVARIGGMGIQVVSDYPETEAQDVLYIKTGV